MSQANRSLASIDDTTDTGSPDDDNDHILTSSKWDNSQLDDYTEHSNKPIRVTKRPLSRIKSKGNGSSILDYLTPSQDGVDLNISPSINRHHQSHRVTQIRLDNQNPSSPLSIDKHLSLINTYIQYIPPPPELLDWTVGLKPTQCSSIGVQPSRITEFTNWVKTNKAYLSHGMNLATIDQQLLTLNDRLNRLIKMKESMLSSSPSPSSSSASAIEGNIQQLQHHIDKLSKIHHELQPLVILHGPSGTGKSILVDLVCKAEHVEILQFHEDEVIDVQSGMSAPTGHLGSTQGGGWDQHPYVRGSSHSSGSFARRAALPHRIQAMLDFIHQASSQFLASSGDGDGGDDDDDDGDDGSPQTTDLLSDRSGQSQRKRSHVKVLHIPNFSLEENTPYITMICQALQEMTMHTHNLFVISVTTEFESDNIGMFQLLDIPPPPLRCTPARRQYSSMSSATTASKGRALKNPYVRSISITKASDIIIVQAMEDLLARARRLTLQVYSSFIRSLITCLTDIPPDGGTHPETTTSILTSHLKSITPEMFILFPNTETLTIPIPPLDLLNPPKGCVSIPTPPFVYNHHMKAQASHSTSVSTTYQRHGHPPQQQLQQQQQQQQTFSIPSLLPLFTLTSSIPTCPQSILVAFNTRTQQDHQILELIRGFCGGDLRHATHMLHINALSANLSIKLTDDITSPSVNGASHQHQHPPLDREAQSKTVTQNSPPSSHSHHSSTHIPLQSEATHSTASTKPMWEQLSSQNKDSCLSVYHVVGRILHYDPSEYYNIGFQSTQSSRLQTKNQRHRPVLPQYLSPSTSSYAMNDDENVFFRQPSHTNAIPPPDHQECEHYPRSHTGQMPPPPSSLPPDQSDQSSSSQRFNDIPSRQKHHIRHHSGMDNNASSSLDDILIDWTTSPHDTQPISFRSIFSSSVDPDAILTNVHHNYLSTFPDFTSVPLSPGYLEHVASLKQKQLHAPRQKVKSYSHSRSSQGASKSTIQQHPNASTSKGENWMDDGGDTDTSSDGEDSFGDNDIDLGPGTRSSSHSQPPPATNCHPRKRTRASSQVADDSDDIDIDHADGGGGGDDDRSNHHRPPLKRPSRTAASSSQSNTSPVPPQVQPQRVMPSWHPWYTSQLQQLPQTLGLSGFVLLQDKYASHEAGFDGDRESPPTSMDTTSPPRLSSPTYPTWNPIVPRDCKLFNARYGEALSALTIHSGDGQTATCPAQHNFPTSNLPLLPTGPTNTIDHHHHHHHHQQQQQQQQQFIPPPHYKTHPILSTAAVAGLMSDAIVLSSSPHHVRGHNYRTDVESFRVSKTTDLPAIVGCLGYHIHRQVCTQLIARFNASQLLMMWRLMNLPNTVNPSHLPYLNNLILSPQRNTPSVAYSAPINYCDRIMRQKEFITLTLSLEHPLNTTSSVRYTNASTRDLSDNNDDRPRGGHTQSQQQHTTVTHLQTPQDTLNQLYSMIYSSSEMMIRTFSNKTIAQIRRLAKSIASGNTSGNAGVMRVQQYLDQLLENTKSPCVNPFPCIPPSISTQPSRSPSLPPLLTTRRPPSISPATLHMVCNTRSDLSSSDKSLRHSQFTSLFPCPPTIGLSSRLCSTDRALLINHFALLTKQFFDNASDIGKMILAPHSPTMSTFSCFYGGQYFSDYSFLSEINTPASKDMALYHSPPREFTRITILLPPITHIVTLVPLPYLIYSMLSCGFDTSILSKFPPIPSSSDPSTMANSIQSSSSSSSTFSRVKPAKGKKQQSDDAKVIEQCIELITNFYFPPQQPLLDKTVKQRTALVSHAAIYAEYFHIPHGCIAHPPPGEEPIEPCAVTGQTPPDNVISPYMTTFLSSRTDSAIFDLEKLRSPHPFNPPLPQPASQAPPFSHPDPTQSHWNIAEVAIPITFQLEQMRIYRETISQLQGLVSQIRHLIRDDHQLLCKVIYAISRWESSPQFTKRFVLTYAIPSSPPPLPPPASASASIQSPASTHNNTMSDYLRMARSSIYRYGSVGVSNLAQVQLLLSGKLLIDSDGDGNDEPMTDRTISSSQHHPLSSLPPGVRSLSSIPGISSQQQQQQQQKQHQQQRRQNLSSHPLPPRPSRKKTHSIDLMDDLDDILPNTQPPSTHQAQHQSNTNPSVPSGTQVDAGEHHHGQFNVGALIGTPERGCSFTYLPGTGQDSQPTTHGPPPTNIHRLSNTTTQPPPTQPPPPAADIPHSSRLRRPPSPSFSLSVLNGNTQPNVGQMMSLSSDKENVAFNISRAAVVDGDSMPQSHQQILTRIQSVKQDTQIIQQQWSQPSGYPEKPPPRTSTTSLYRRTSSAVPSTRPPPAQAALTPLDAPASLSTMQPATKTTTHTHPYGHSLPLGAALPRGESQPLSSQLDPPHTNPYLSTQQTQSQQPMQPTTQPKSQSQSQSQPQPRRPLYPSTAGRRVFTATSDPRQLQQPPAVSQGSLMGYLKPLPKRSSLSQSSSSMASQPSIAAHAEAAHVSQPSSQTSQHHLENPSSQTNPPLKNPFMSPPPPSRGADASFQNDETKGSQHSLPGKPTSQSTRTSLYRRH